MADEILIRMLDGVAGQYVFVSKKFNLYSIVLRTFDCMRGGDMGICNK